MNPRTTDNKAAFLLWVKFSSVQISYLLEISGSVSCFIFLEILGFLWSFSYLNAHIFNGLYKYREIAKIMCKL